MASKSRPKARRPTQAQLYLSQKRLVGLLSQVGPINTAATIADTSVKGFKKFLYQDTKQIRRNFNRSPIYRKLYEFAGKTGPIAGVRIPKVRIDITPKGPTVFLGRKLKIGEREDRAERGLPPTPKSAYPYEQRHRAQMYMHAVMAQQELPETRMTEEWKLYTSERNLPTSIEAIKKMFREGQIGVSQTRTLFDHWRDIYAITDDHYNDLLERNGPEFDIFQI